MQRARNRFLSRAAGTLAALAVCAGGASWADTAPRAHGNTQVSGTGEFDGYDVGASCGGPPAGFEEYVFFTLKLSGDLVGCLWTLPLEFKATKANSYQEWGLEVIEACLDVNGNGSCDLSEPYGMFETSYHFTSKWAGEPFLSAQLNGRCQHPITEGSGTGDFEGATGRLDFKDDVAEGDFDWTGHIDFDAIF